MSLVLSGFIAAIWLLIGVLVAAKHYPGYNNKLQFLSELGASQAPTKKFSPAINNFPLSILFTVFGASLILSWGFVAIGVCIVVHVIATFVAGVFPMDNDPYTRNASISGKIHATSGFFMFISLLVASSIGIFITNFGITFQAVSIIASVLSIIFSIKLSREFSLRGMVGLFQRLNYGTQLFWLSCLSFYVFLDS